MVSNASKDVREPSLGTDAVEFRRFDQGVGDGSGFAAPLRAHEEIIFPSQSDGAHGSFGAVVIQLQDAR
jgi:hypothetical protein